MWENKKGFRHAVIGVKEGKMAKYGLETGLKRIEMGNINSKLIRTMQGMYSI